jgi:hypothetical protein
MPLSVVSCLRLVCCFFSEAKWKTGGLDLVKKKKQTARIKNKIARHPEEQEGEIFICNASDACFEGLGWNTKRIGKISYKKDNVTPTGKSKLKPVFIQRREAQDLFERNLVLGVSNPGWLKKLLKK